MIIPKYVLPELRWIMTELHNWNGRSFQPLIPSQMIFDNASRFGMGAKHEESGMTIQMLFNRVFLDFQEGWSGNERMAN